MVLWKNCAGACWAVICPRWSEVSKENGNFPSLMLIKFLDTIKATKAQNKCFKSITKCKGSITRAYIIISVFGSWWYW